MSWFKKSFSAFPGFIGNFYIKTVEIDKSYDDFIEIRACLLRILRLKRCGCSDRWFHLCNRTIEKSLLLVVWGILSHIFFNDRNHGDFRLLFNLWSLHLVLISKWHKGFIFECIISLVLLCICLFNFLLSLRLFLEISRDTRLIQLKSERLHILAWLCCTTVLNVDCV